MTLSRKDRAIFSVLLLNLEELIVFREKHKVTSSKWPCVTVCNNIDVTKTPGDWAYRSYHLCLCPLRLCYFNLKKAKLRLIEPVQIVYFHKLLMS